MEKLPENHCYLTYDEVISKAQAILPHFAVDLSQFNAYDPWFTQEVKDQLLSGIYTGLKETDEFNQYFEINRLTDLLDLKLAQARHLYEKLNYYVDKAIEDMKVTHQTFGYSDYLKARTSVKRMIPLLKQAVLGISKDNYEARLHDAGMPWGLPSEMAQLAAEMTDIYRDLKNQRQQHLKTIRERIELFNSLWDILAKIGEAAKIIFANNPVRLEIYDLYALEDSDNEPAEKTEQEKGGRNRETGEMKKENPSGYKA